MIERSVVYIAENVHNELRAQPPLSVEIKHRWDLINHRDYLSHPGKVEFSNPSLMEFIKQKRHYKDPKAVLIWRARKSILEELQKHGSTRPVVWPLKIRLLGGLAENVSTAIHYCLNTSIERPSLQLLVQTIQVFFEKYEEAVSKAENTFP